MGNKKLKYLPIRRIDRRIFEMIREEIKKIETRAGGPKYKDIKAGDMIVFNCGGEKLTKRVSRVRKFKSTRAMLKIYTVNQIDPMISTIEDLKKMYDSFTGYKERIKKYGLIVFELK